MTITLYGDEHWISPYVLTCYVSLREMGIPFETKPVSLASGEHQRADFAPSLTRKVPAIVHDGFWLSESSAIVEYLEECFGGPHHARILPSGLQDRARARQIMAWIRSDSLALREERPTTTIFYAKTDKPLSPAARAAADKVIAVATELLPAGRQHVFHHFTAVDADLSLMLMRLVKNGDPLPAHLRDYAELQWQRESMKEFVDHARPAHP
jgi:glutathione S-transferase